MKIDLSFLPEDIIPKSIKELMHEEFEYPYVDEKIYAKNFLKSKRHGQEASPPDEIREKRRENFYRLEKELIRLGCLMKKAHKEAMAELIFKYLVEIGSKFAKPKEELVKYYQKTNNKRCMKWIIKRINDQLKCEHVEEENKKLKQLKKKIEKASEKKKKVGK